MKLGKLCGISTAVIGNKGRGVIFFGKMKNGESWNVKDYNIT